VQGRDGKSNYAITQHHSFSSIGDGGKREKLSAEQMTLAESRKNTRKARQRQNLPVRILAIVIVCCASVVVLASCYRGYYDGISEDRLRRMLYDGEAQEIPCTLFRLF